MKDDECLGLKCKHYSYKDIIEGDMFIGRDVKCRLTGEYLICGFRGPNTIKKSDKCIPNMQLEGNQVVNCPACGHIHYIVIEEEKQNEN